MSALATVGASPIRRSSAGWLPSFWIVTCITLVQASAALTAAAADGDLFRVAGVRVVDVLCIAALPCLVSVLARDVRARKVTTALFVVSLVSLVWICWTVMPMSVGPLDLRTVLAELQFPIYLLACYAVCEILGARGLLGPVTLASVIGMVIAGVAVVAAIVSQHQIGGDLATITCALALWCRASRKFAVPVLWLLFAIAVTTCVLSDQRAALITSLPALLIGWVAPGRQVRKVGPTSVVLGLLVAVTTIVWLLLSDAVAKIQASFDSWLQFTFARQAQLDASASRVIQIDQAVTTISDSPWFGYGGGIGIRFFDPGVNSDIESNITHNSVLDMSLRFGVPLAVVLVGLLAFLIAQGAARGWRVPSYWLWGSVWVALSIASKGMVESVLYKPRLAFVFALSLSVILVVRKASVLNEDAGSTSD